MVMEFIYSHTRQYWTYKTQMKWNFLFNRSFTITQTWNSTSSFIFIMHTAHSETLVTLAYCFRVLFSTEVCDFGRSLTLTEAACNKPQHELQVNCRAKLEFALTPLFFLIAIIFCRYYHVNFDSPKNNIHFFIIYDDTHKTAGEFLNIL